MEAMKSTLRGHCLPLAVPTACESVALLVQLRAPLSGRCKVHGVLTGKHRIEAEAVAEHVLLTVSFEVRRLECPVVKNKNKQINSSVLCLYTQVSPNVPDLEGIIIWGGGVGRASFLLSMSLSVCPPRPPPPPPVSLCLCLPACLSVCLSVCLSLHFYFIFKASPGVVEQEGAAGLS